MGTRTGTRAKDQIGHSFSAIMARSLHSGIFAALALLTLVAQPPLALTQDVQSQEQRALALDKQLICPVCPGETLNQSRATLAQQMRAILRDRLAAGQSEEDITAYFVSVYGESVLASPPRSGSSLLVWVVPPIALLLGFSGVIIVIRSLRTPTLQTAEAPFIVTTSNRAAAEDLAPYLNRVDKEMQDSLQPEPTSPDNEDP
jgi:cytochrome c-type biogenesis protein CcmH